MGNHQLWPPPTIGWWLCVVFAFLISFLFCSWASLCLFYSTWDGWWPASSSFGQSVKSIFGIPCWHRGNSTLGWRCCCQSYRSRQHGKAMVCYLVTCPSVSEKVSKLTLLITCCYKCGLVSHISWPTRLGNVDFTGASCWVIAFCQTRYDLHQFAILDDAGLVSLSQQFLSCVLMAARRCSSASATRETWAQGGASGFFPFSPSTNLLGPCWHNAGGKIARHLSAGNEVTNSGHRGLLMLMPPLICVQSSLFGRWLIHHWLCSFGSATAAEPMEVGSWPLCEVEHGNPMP